MADLYAAVYNPDVLSCLANLSNDEVFTPPEMANQVLDMLPESLWSNPNARFLDPCCKTGVFLREIAKRLIRAQMPGFDQCMAVIDYKRANGQELSAVDNAYLERLQPVLDHIFHEQLFGMGITSLTSLLARRSLYCSKWANGRYSVVGFDTSEGNIRYRNIQHSWEGGKGRERCKFCGASKVELEDNRESDETYAYEFIHRIGRERLFDNMQFDVIVGNPPYQLSDGGAQKSASPIYQKFIEQAIKLKPRYLTMIVPARWYSGGKGLDAFREQMLSERHLSILHDFPETSDCFPGVNIRGGVCYFLWDRDYTGDCHVINHKNGQILDESTRPLREPGAETFIRYNQAIEIMRKVRSHQEPTMDLLVSARKPFGLATNFDDLAPKPFPGSVELYRFRRQGYIKESAITKNPKWIGKWKVFEPYASPGQDDYPHLILSKPIVAGPGTACTETYLVVGPFDDETTAQNVAAYMKTQFFRFMLLLLKSTQHITQKVYGYVPQQDFSQVWTDELLYAKYGITENEIDFINTLIKPLSD